MGRGSRWRVVLACLAAAAMGASAVVALALPLAAAAPPGPPFPPPVSGQRVYDTGVSKGWPQTADEHPAGAISAANDEARYHAIIAGLETF